MSSEYISAKKKYKKGDLKKEDYEIIRKENTYFGYSSQQKFMYAIGGPSFMIFISILLLVAWSCIEEEKNKLIKQLLIIISCSAIFVSSYLIIWAFWYRADFPLNLYYIVIGIFSLVSVLIMYKSISFIQFLKRRKEKRILSNENFIAKGFEAIELLNAKTIQ